MTELCLYALGLFNVGNQLLVSLDLFFKIRAQIKLGEDPALAALHILNNIHILQGTCAFGYIALSVLFFY